MKYSTGAGTARLAAIRAAGLTEGLPRKLEGQAAALIHASLAKGTWEKYSSGWKALEDYQAFTAARLAWPLQQAAIRGFATYLITVKGLKTTSVRTYLSSLVCLHKLKGFNNFKLEDNLLAAILRGAENLQLAGPAAKPNNRRVMTMALLRHLGHRLAGSGWEKTATQSIWAACLVAFFGTMRMGELLAADEAWADPSSTFTWADVKYRPTSDSFLLRIKLSKMRSPEGEYIDIFPFKKIRGCCPVAALKRQHSLQRELQKGRPEDPVFIYPSGKLVTTEALNRALKILLEDVVDYSRDSITCHSFRAGLPSLISQHPDLMSSEDVKGWGRWSSEAYTRYTRLKNDQKFKIFQKIADIIN